VAAALAGGALFQLFHWMKRYAATNSQAMRRNERVWFIERTSSGARGACQEAVGSEAAGFEAE
jgi:hypothetical protein